jgi:tight adherence protein C
VTSAVAITFGAAALAVVLLLGAAARRPVRRDPPGDGQRGPPPRRAHRHPISVLAVALLTGVALAAVGPLAVATALAAAWLARRRRRNRLTAARRRAVETAMPDVVELLVLCIQAGCSPVQAVLAVAARAPPVVGPAFADVELRLHRGQSLAEAIGALDGTTGPLGREVARAIAAADRDGQPITPVLDRLALDARAARRRLGEADARRLPVRLTFPLVLCTLPAFVLLAIAPAVLGALSTLQATAP